MKLHLAMVISALVAAPVVNASYYPVEATASLSPSYCTVDFSCQPDGNCYYRSNDVKFSVTSNKNWTIVKCKLVDQSPTSADTAEPTKITSCSAMLEDGTMLTGGTGQGIAANNDVTGGDWGNVMVTCKFSAK